MQERRLTGIRRDAAAAAELAAVAAAALQTMQDTGGTAVERAGALRVITMARTCAESAVEQAGHAEAALRDGRAW